MTFSLIARCERTGKFGICQATGTPAVGTRCYMVVPGSGAVLVQASIDYSLVASAAEMVRQGMRARDVLARLQEKDPMIAYRQVGIITADDIAVLSGPHARDHASMIHGDNFAAAGNMVCDANVVGSMANAFRRSAGEELEERLLRAVEAGRDAGGQPTGQNSAVLAVYTELPFPIVDLRVDMHDEPVGELRRLLDWYKPLIPYYIQRNADPRVLPWREYLQQMDWPLRPAAAITGR